MQVICIKKRREKRICQHWRYRRCINTTTRRLHKNNEERLITATRNNTDNTRIKRTTIPKKQKLCGDKDERVNHISECSELVQKEYKTRQDWVGKVIHWELCKKFKFNYTNKWYMHNPEAVLENNTYQLLWDFEIHNWSPDLGQTTRPRYSHKKKRKK